MKANIYFGSQETKKEEYLSRVSPYSGEIVSKVAVCDANDAKRALNIAQEAAKEAKKTTIAQRCNWLLDVAKKLKENREDLAKTITDEVGKPIMFSKIEVDRCIETVTLSAEVMRTMHGETINTDAMNSGKKTMAF